MVPDFSKTMVAPSSKEQVRLNTPSKVGVFMLITWFYLEFCL